MSKMKMVSIGTTRQVCLLSAVVLLIAGFCFGKPAVSLSPSSGPPTSQLLVSGSGFKPHAAIEIFFDTKKEAKATANGSGSFSKITIQAPASALPGNHWVSAVQRPRRTEAHAPFLVNTNWNQFGFTADGKRDNPYENVLNRRTVGSLNLLWSYTTGGSVRSSPSVANGVVYVESDDAHLYALKASTGAKLWTYPVNDEGAVYSSPAVANGVVYVIDNQFDSHVVALDAITGVSLWSFEFGALNSPVVANGVVYVVNGNAYALNASTGSLLWTYEVGFQVNKTPAVANGVFYTGSLVNAVFRAVDASTGASLWQFAAGQDRDFAFNSSPAVANGVVYAVSDDGNLYALNATTGTFLWNYPIGAGGNTPAVANGVVYVDSTDLFALNASTGALLWTFPMGGTPAVANGVVYLGSGNNVDALNAATGALLWSYATGGSVETRPAIANGVVYVGSDDGKVYAFGLSDSFKR